MGKIRNDFSSYMAYMTLNSYVGQIRAKILYYRFACFSACGTLTNNHACENNHKPLFVNYTRPYASSNGSLDKQVYASRIKPVVLEKQCLLKHHLAAAQDYSVAR